MHRDPATGFIFVRVVSSVRIRSGLCPAFVAIRSSSFISRQSWDTISGQSKIPSDTPLPNTGGQRACGRLLFGPLPMVALSFSVGTRSMLTHLAKRKLLKRSPEVKVRCWSGGGHLNEVWNWGDALSPTICKFVTGREPEVIDFLEYPSEPNLVICGSVLRWISASSIVWGAGAISARGRFMEKGEKPLHVAAVRGPLTRQRFLDAGVPCPDIYGDPALLFPEYYHPGVEQEYELGIIPHYIDHDAPALERLARDERVKILDITQAGVDDKVFSFVDDVARCKRIASSSLHGMILADSYGIPSLWLEFSDKVVGKGFKFFDYFHSVGRADSKPVQMNEQGPNINELIRLIDRKKYRFKFRAHRLLNSFPM